MSRAIFAAASIFALAALVLHRTVLAGAFLEPALLLTMGSFFLLAARMCGSPPRRIERAVPEKAALQPEQQRASA